MKNAQVSRRTLLGGAAAAAVVTYTGVSTRFAYADPGYTGDTLVLLSLRGGFDGLSAIVPVGDPAYLRARPTIGVPTSQVIAGDGSFGLNPAMAPLLPLWQGGKLAAVHAVGQPDPSRSHFAAMEAMENAAPGTSIRTGWLDRMLGVTGATGPLAGVSLGEAMPARVLAGPAPAVSMGSVDGFTLAGESAKRPIAAALRALYADAPPLLAGPARAADRALTATAALRTAGYTPAATYPDTGLGAALRDVARLIKTKAGLVTAAVDCGDWDMHEGLGAAGKGQRMYDNLTELSLALAAFAADLGDALNGVTLITVSEFGRRVAENASHGTDHGHGNAMLLLGGGVRGGRTYAKWPTLAPSALVAGDLAATSDYRAVIGEVLQKRCGVGSLEPVFPSVSPSSFGLVNSR